MNDITKLLNINQKGIIINSVSVDKEKGIKYISVSKELVPYYCPECGARMHSKGVSVRNINAPLIQDGYKMIWLVNQRRFQCSNPFCNYKMVENFNFLERYKHNANFVPFMVLNYMKDLNVTAVQAAKKYNISDTLVHNYVLEYLDCDRLPLPEILSVDEVYLEFDKKNKYALVLMNFLTGEIIDILPNRFEREYGKYFYNIPLMERNKVKIIICDMYNPYIRFTCKYFYNAVPVVDSFHVIQWINNKINLYINQVKKKYKERDEASLEASNIHQATNFKTQKQSKEVYLLNNYKFLLLSDEDNIDYHYKDKWNYSLNCYTNTYKIEAEFMKLDKNFSKIRELKQIYLEFNKSFPLPPLEATDKLEEIIKVYRNSNLAIFREFADILSKEKEYIINSFLDIRTVTSETYETEFLNASGTLRRMSNGPMESFNRKPKDMKRNSRGFSNIRYTINRILWSNRRDEGILAIPKSEKEIHTSTGIVRGPYKKKNKEIDK